MSSSGTLTVAHILADLMDLQNADPKAAKELLEANKTLLSSQSFRREPIKGASLRQQSFDLSSRRAGDAGPVPSLMRMTSTMSGISVPETPSDPGDDEDMTRAKELISLYAKRDKFKKLGDTGMGRAKEQVDDVIARYR